MFLQTGSVENGKAWFLKLSNKKKIKFNQPCVSIEKQTYEKSVVFRTTINI